MANKPWVIDLKSTPDKWVTLLTHLNNKIPYAYRCVFPDNETAIRAYERMVYACGRSPGLKLMLARKQNEVYVVKPDVAQEVIIEGS